jgi:hypothetical protein
MILDEDFYDKLTTCLETFPERGIVLKWIVDEWYEYVQNKFYSGDKRTDVHIEFMKENGWKRPPDGFWSRQVFQYLDRADLFGVGEPGSQAPERGQQAAMKMATTLIDGLAWMVRAFGIPPDAGHTSGEIAYDGLVKGG